MVIAHVAEWPRGTKTIPTEYGKYKILATSPLVSGKLYASQQASFVLFTRINEHVCYFSICF